MNSGNHQTISVASKSNYEKLIKIALILSLITIFYNLFEGVVSIYFGLNDDTLALAGFGIDSFVEVLSGLGIMHLVIRMKNGTIEQRDGFERTALKITGSSFYLLTVGLIFGSILNIYYGNKPETTLAGIIIAGISLITMYLLIKYKIDVGRKLNSDAIIADANCTKTCFILSIILLVSSLGFEIFKIGFLDIAGSLGIAYYAFKEGKESFEKARSNKLSCSCDENDH